MQNKWVINVLLVIIMILVVIACIVGYLYFTQEEAITEITESNLKEEEKIYN